MMNVSHILDKFQVRDNDERNSLMGCFPENEKTIETSEFLKKLRECEQRKCSELRI